MVSRKYIQQHIVNNDLVGFRKAVSMLSNWPNVPKGRFKKRVKYLEDKV